MNADMMETIDLNEDTETLLAQSSMEGEDMSSFEHIEVRDHWHQNPVSSCCKTKIIWLASAMAALGGILFGYDIGIVSGAVLQLKVKFDLDCAQQEMVVSVMLMGAVLGSLTGGFIVDTFGRRIGIILNDILFLSGALILAFAQSFDILVVGRFIIGIAVSLSAIAECIYISEIAPPKRRGLLVSLNELGIAVGLLVSYLVDFAFIKVDNGWRYMFGLSAILAVVQGVGMFYLPTSPRWLISKGREDEACRMIYLLEEVEDAQEEVFKIKDGLKCEKSHSILNLFSNVDNMRTRMFIGCGLVFFQQFTGQPTLLFYAPTIFQAIGYQTSSAATLATVGLGLIKVVSTAISLLCVDKIGRRIFLLSGATVMTASMTILWISTQFLTFKDSAGPCGHFIHTHNYTQDTNSTEINDVQNLNFPPAHWISLQPTPTQSREWTSASGLQYSLNRTPINPSPSLYYNVSKTVSYSNGMGVVAPSPDRTFLRPSPSAMLLSKDGTSKHGTTAAPVNEMTVGHYLSLITLLLFVAAYAFGYGPVSWLVLSEIFPVSIKGRALAMATIFNWGSNLIVSFTFLDIMDAIGTSSTFLLYSVLGVLAWLFVFFNVPETKNRSLEKISAELSLRYRQDSSGCPCMPCRRGQKTLQFQQEISQNQLLLSNEDVTM